MRNPDRNIPRATILGTIATAVVYMLSLTAVFGIVPTSKLATATAPFSDAANAMFGGTWAGNVMAIAVIISGFGALNGWTMICAEMPLAGRERRPVPQRFKRMSKNRVPAYGIIASTVLASVAMIINYLGLDGATVFTTLVLMTGITAAIPYGFSALAQIKWRWIDHRTLQTPRFVRDMVVAVLSLVFSILFIWYSRNTGHSFWVYWAPFLLAVGALLLGIPVYLAQRRHMSRRASVLPTGDAGPDDRTRRLTMRIVIALGGDALLRRSDPMTTEVQRRNIRIAAEAIAPLAAERSIVVVHGDGPQVGLLSLQAEAYRDVEPYPLDVLDAGTQGMIGYLIQEELRSLLPLEHQVATLLHHDRRRSARAAFASPAKFVGPVYPKRPPTRWPPRGAGPSGRRRFLAAGGAIAEPQRILEIAPITWLLERGTVVICAGGGGIPTMSPSSGPGALVGVEAVIDKDLAERAPRRGRARGPAPHGDS